MAAQTLYAALACDRAWQALLEAAGNALPARLAEREGHEAEQATALQRAHERYTRFDMTAQGARVDQATGQV